MKYIWQKRNWTQFIWDNHKLISQLGRTRFAQSKLLTKVHVLGLSLEKKTQAEILVEEAIKTSAIEGQKYSTDSVRSSVARHLGLPVAGLTHHNRQIDGLVDVLLDATQNANLPLNIKRLKSWHAALFPTGYSGLKPVRAGKWRGPHPMQVVSGPIGRERVHYQALPANRIDKEIKQFISWWETSVNKLEGLLRAAIVHFRFVTIHPFEDGNGRIARALTDMALAQDEKLATRFYSLSAQIMKERKEYYSILEQCQKGNGDITKWLLWFLECFTRAVENSEKLISKILIKAEFWREYGQAIMNERQRKVVNRLLDAGKGNFVGGLTTRKYVSMTKVSRATAYREISDLLNKNILRQNPGRGRNISYDLNWVE